MKNNEIMPLNWSYRNNTELKYVRNNCSICVGQAYNLKLNGIEFDIFGSYGG